MIGSKQGGIFMSEEIVSTTDSHYSVGIGGGWWIIIVAIIIGLSCLAIGYVWADNSCDDRFEDWKMNAEHDWVCTIEHAESCGWVNEQGCVRWCDNAISFLVNNGTLQKVDK